MCWLLAAVSSERRSHNVRKIDIDIERYCTRNAKPHETHRGWWSLGYLPALGAILTKTEKEEEKKGRKEAFPTTVTNQIHHVVPKAITRCWHLSEVPTAPRALLPLA
jgi:hypothetical protein